MEIAQAQRDVRETFIGGFAGQLVSSALWLLSAAVCTWHSFIAGELVLVFGGFLIFPLTQLTLRMMGRPSSLAKGHPMNALAMQIAFTLPLTLPLVLVVASFRPEWFYPALMITLGAHYLPFIFLYGMRQFGALAGVLILSGIGIALYVPHFVSLGGWLTGVLLFVFAFVGRQATHPDR